MVERTEKKEGKVVEKTLQKQLDGVQEQIDRLLQAYLRGVISGDEHDKQKVQLQAKKDALRAKMGLTEDVKLDMKEVGRKFDILIEFADIIENGTHDERIDALSILGSNLTLTRRKVSITRGILYQAIEKGLLEAKLKNSEFEPKRCTSKDLLLLETNSTITEPVMSSVVQQKTAISGGCLPIAFSMEFSEANASKELSVNVRPNHDLTTSGILLPKLDAFRTLNWQKIKRELEQSGILGQFEIVVLQN